MSRFVYQGGREREEMMENPEFEAAMKMLYKMIVSFYSEAPSMNDTIIEACRMFGIEPTQANWWSIPEQLAAMYPEWEKEIYG